MADTARGAALVTGGSRRIGRVLTQAAADAGFDVAIHVRTIDDDAEAAAADVRARGRKASIHACDLRDEGATAPLVGAAESELDDARGRGQIDAGRLRPMLPFARIAP